MAESPLELQGNYAPGSHLFGLLSLNSKTGSIQPKDGEAVKLERFEEVSKEFGFCGCAASRAESLWLSGGPLR